MIQELYIILPIFPVCSYCLTASLEIEPQIWGFNQEHLDSKFLAWVAHFSLPVHFQSFLFLTPLSDLVNV